MDEKVERTHPIIKKVSRRQFLKMMTAGMGTAVPAFLLPSPDWPALLGSQPGAFTSWGQTYLSFDSLSMPYMDLGDWHRQFIPLVTGR